MVGNTLDENHTDIDTRQVRDIETQHLSYWALEPAHTYCALVLYVRRTQR